MPAILPCTGGRAQRVPYPIMVGWAREASEGLVSGLHSARQYRDPHMQVV
jgi:hypothetical protein